MGRAQGKGGCSFSKRAGLALLALGFSFSAWAWNGTGHRLIAHIAWQQLSPKEQTILGKLLQRHPDYFRWIKHRAAYPGATPSYVAFVEAATWADDIRRQHQNSLPEDSIPPFAEAGEVEPHPQWHFQDGARSGSEAGQLALALATLPGQLSAQGNRAPLALVWLEHLVGDAHQPLHTWSRDLPSGQSDRGGNGLTLRGEATAGKDANLHAYWDELPGPKGLRGAALAHRAEELAQGCTLSEGKQSPTRWRQESQDLAKTVAYGGLPLTPPVVLSPAYASQAQRVAALQLCKAGKRLGALLHQQLRNGDFPQ